MFISETILRGKLRSLFFKALQFCKHRRVIYFKNLLPEMFARLTAAELWNKVKPWFLFWDLSGLQEQLKYYKIP